MSTTFVVVETQVSARLTQLDVLFNFVALDLVVTSNPMVNLMGRNTKMISVGRFAELAKVSARTVRYYESVGLLPSSSRGENNYRHYDVKLLDRMNRIRDLQDLGFSLDEIKQIINFSESDISNRLKTQLLKIEQEIDDLEERKNRIKELLSVSNKIETGDILTEMERNLYMESIKEEIIKGLQDRYDVVTESTLSYLERDGWLIHHSEFGALLDGVKKCIEFAKQKN